MILERLRLEVFSEVLKLREKYFEIFPEKFQKEEKEKNLIKLAKELGYKIERLK